MRHDSGLQAAGEQPNLPHFHLDPLPGVVTDNKCVLADLPTHMYFYLLIRKPWGILYGLCELKGIEGKAT